MLKKGDTLIEVTLAIGIFSMVAVSVAAVMSNGTAGAETALETTLTREEIDAQAEALRFIHDSFISDQNHEDDRYSKLWTAITENALDPVGENINAITSYAPATCDELYTKKDDETQSPLGAQNAFVVNTNYLGNYSNLDVGEVKEETIKNTIVSYKNSNDKFGIASTYPHLIYHNGSTTEDESVLTSDYDELLRAEGIYVIAVKDSGTTVAGEEAITTKSAFYDFYIRTCWYGVGDNFPSTISTVIRLYNPEAIVARKRKKPEPEPEPESTCKEEGTMQCFDPSKATGDTLSLTDSRDGTTYGVAKIGNLWWMAQNLNLAGGTVLTSELSNVSQNYTLPASSNSEPFEEGVFNAGGESCSSGSPCYSYYNYRAATANTNSGSYDICPKGWRLPNRAELAALINTYSTGNALVGSPFAGVYSGYYGLNSSLDYELKNGGSYGFYWTSTTYEKNGDKAYLMYYYNDHAQIAPYLKSTGASIRCIKKP